jgi:Zn-dependent protease
MMGGLAIEGRPRDTWGHSSFEPYTPYQPRSRTPQEQIIISAAGPAIQLLLAGIIAGAVYLGDGGLTFMYAGPIPIPSPILGGELAKNPAMWLLVVRLLEINIFWPLINLLPVIPLDGGQIAMQLLIQQDPWTGTQRALWLSVIVGGGAAVFGLLVMDDMFMMFLFASLAVSCYLTLQQMGGGRQPW